MQRLTRDRLVPPLVAGLAMWVITTIRSVVASLAGSGSWVHAVLPSLPALLYWLALAPGILWLGAQLPLKPGLRLRAVVIHALCGAAAAALYAQLMVLVFRNWWALPPAPGAGPLDDWAIRFQFGLLAYAMLLSWGYVHEYFTSLREREVAVARLETELAEARLAALKAQLHPHFLFNTLHAITVLIRRDSEEATRMVMRLGDLLRMTLVDADRPEVPLEHELTFLRLYLEIEQTRFRERLRVEWDVPAGLERAAVPPLILQPIVENAIKHGVEPQPGGGSVRISCARHGDQLTLQVADNGIGLRPGPLRNTGIGLRATRTRLETLFPGTSSFALTTPPGGGVLVTLGIPWREAPVTGGTRA